MPHNIDPENMFKAIWEFPENIQEALEIGAGITLHNQYENIDHILIAGMGLLSYQSFIWLQSGVWNEYPMLTVFNFIFL